MPKKEKVKKGKAQRTTIKSAMDLSGGDGEAKLTSTPPPPLDGVQLAIAHAKCKEQEKQLKALQKRIEELEKLCEQEDKEKETETLVMSNDSEQFIRKLCIEFSKVIVGFFLTHEYTRYISSKTAPASVDDFQVDAARFNSTRNYVFVVLESVLPSEVPKMERINDSYHLVEWSFGFGVHIRMGTLNVVEVMAELEGSKHFLSFSWSFAKSRGWLERQASWEAESSFMQKLEEHMCKHFNETKWERRKLDVCCYIKTNDVVHSLAHSYNWNRFQESLLPEQIWTDSARHELPLTSFDIADNWAVRYVIGERRDDFSSRVDVFLVEPRDGLYRMLVARDYPCPGIVHAQGLADNYYTQESFCSSLVKHKAKLTQHFLFTVDLTKYAY